MGTNGDIPQNQPWTAHFFAIRILGYHFSSRLTATLNLCLIYFKITWALAILLEHMHKKFEINRTKIKGGCQSGRKVVTHNSKSDLPLYPIFFLLSKKTKKSFGQILCRALCRTRGKSLLESWGTTFLPYWQPPLTFVRFISNFLCMCSDSMASAHVLLK